MKVVGHRTFTRESALRTVLQVPGIDPEYDSEDKIVAIKVGKRANAGNGTLGALDYLGSVHKIPAVREFGKQWHLINRLENAS